MDPARQRTLDYYKLSPIRPSFLANLGLHVDLVLLHVREPIKLFPRVGPTSPISHTSPGCDG